MKAGPIQYQSRLFRELIEKGRAQGLEEARRERREEGMRALLGRQLTKRFGPLPDWARDKLAAARTDRLEQVADRIFDAASLEDALQD